MGRRTGTLSTDATETGNLVERTRKGDQTAFRALFDLYAGPVLRFATHFTRDREAAKDLTQDVFVTAYDKLDDLREPAAFRAWLFRIAATACRRHVRDRRRSPEQTMESFEVVRYDEREVAEPLLREMKLEAVGEAIRELDNPRHREVLELFYGEDELTAREIGEQLDIPVSTVTSTLTRVRRRLRKRALTLLHEQAEAVGLS